MGPYLVLNPPDPFVDREPVRAAVAAELARRRAAGSPALFHLNGPPGIGSSATALAIAAIHRDHFPDGILPLAVSTPSQAVVPFDQLLGFALRYLGCPADQLPEGEHERIGAYRHLVAGKRILVIVDGITQPNQVEPLIPDSPYAMVITTGRRDWRMLQVLNGFVSLRLAALDDDAARELFAAVSRTSVAEPTAAALLATCAGHPLAIRLVAGLVAGQPEYAEPLLADLRARGVAAIEADDVPALTNLLDSVYAGLPDDVQRAYRWLSQHPGPDFTIAAAAVCLGESQDATRQMLRRMVDLHLLFRGDSAPPDGTRFQFHPILGNHAHGMAWQHDDPERLRQLTRDVIEWYRREAIAWEQTTIDRWRVIAAYRGGIAAATAPPGVDVRDLAMAWLDAECHNLVAAVRRAVELDFDAAARDLCFPLWTPFHSYGHTGWLDTTGTGIEAAGRLNDRLALMQLHSQRGSAWLAIGRLPEATREFTRSLELAREVGHLLGQQSAVEWLGKVAARRGDVDTAMQRYDESERLGVMAAEQQPEWVDAAQLRRIVALLDLQRGRALRVAGSTDQAVDKLSAARQYFDTTKEKTNRGKVRYELGMAHAAAGQLAEAAAALAQAQRLFAADRALRWQATVLLAQADTEARRGGDEGAPLLVAEEILRSLGDDRADAVRRRRTELGH